MISDPQAHSYRMADHGTGNNDGDNQECHFVASLKSFIGLFLQLTNE